MPLSMAGYFNRLPGFQRTPAGIERRLLRALPRLTLIGSLLLSLPAVLSRGLIGLGLLQIEPAMMGLIDIYVIGLVVLHWTAMLTVGIGAFIVMVMKGPAYVADPYPMNEADD
jgi:preprotein translocase subunit SecY